MEEEQENDSLKDSVHFETKDEKKDTEREKAADEKQLELTPEQWEKINKQIKQNQPHIEKALQEIPVNVRGVYLSVVVSFLFIVLAAYINQVQVVYDLGVTIRTPYEHTGWNLQSELANVLSVNDIIDYIQKVSIPLSYTDMGNYNYMIGFRITIKNSKIINNPVSAYSSATKYIQMDPKIDPGDAASGESKDRKGIWEYMPGDGYHDNGGYVLYFLSNQTLEESLQIWREAKKMLLSQLQLSNIAIEYLYHNSNEQCTLYYYQTFTITGAGAVSVDLQLIGSFIEKFEKWEGESLTILIIFIIYTLGFSIQIFKLIQNLTRTCKTILVKRKLDLVWHEYIEIIAVSLSFITLIMLSAFVFSERGKFQLPITKKQDLDNLIIYNQNFRLFIQFLALASLFVSFKIIVILRYKFPSFGILFDTILSAKTDILNFMMIALIILTGFAFMGNIDFGYEDFQFRTVTLSYQVLYDMTLTNLKSKEQLKAVNQNLSTVFIVFFVIVFFMILLNVFLAIVMSTYDTLKKNSQLTLNAKAEMIGEQTQEWFNALTNLIFFRVQSAEQDALEYEKLNELNQEDLNEEDKNGITEKLKMHETLILANVRVDLIKIFKTNFALLSSLNRPSLLTHEQNVQKISDTLRKILKRYMLEYLEKQRLKTLVDYNFHLIIEMMIYIVYIIIFINMFLLILRVSDSYSLRELTKDNFEIPLYGEGLTLEEVNTQSDMFSYINEVFIPGISKKYLQNLNYFLDNQRARITLNQYALTPNPNTFSNNVIPKYIKEGSVSQNTNQFRGKTTELLYRYIQPGTKETFKKGGGYVFYLMFNQNMSEVIKILKNDEVLGINGSSLAIEWITYNANYNLYSYSYIAFQHTLSGSVERIINSNAIELDYFRDDVPIRGILQIIYFFFTLYYITSEIREWWSIWKLVKEEEKAQKKELKL